MPKVAALLFITTPAPSEPFDAAERESETGDRTLDLEPAEVGMGLKDARAETSRSTPA